MWSAKDQATSPGPEGRIEDPRPSPCSDKQARGIRVQFGMLRAHEGFDVVFLPLFVTFPTTSAPRPARLAPRGRDERPGRKARSTDSRPRTIRPAALHEAAHRACTRDWLAHPPPFKGPRRDGSNRFACDLPVASDPTPFKVACNTRLGLWMDGDEVVGRRHEGGCRLSALGFRSVGIGLRAIAGLQNR